MFEKNAVDKYVRINPQTRLFEPVWLYRDILPFALGPDPAIVSGAIALTAAAPTKTIPYKLKHSSLGYDDQVGNPLRINQIAFTDSIVNAENGGFTIFMTDMGDERQYMNYPVHCQTFAGTGQLSARLAEDLLLPTRHQLNLTLSKISGFANKSVNVILFGQSFDTWSSNLQKFTVDRAEMIKEINRLLERRKYVTPYWLTTDGGVVVVPANQTVEVDTLVGSEGHLELTHILRAFGDATDATAQPFQVELINPQTRQSLMNGALHSYLIGNAQNPQPLPAPLLIPAGQTLRFRITNISNTTNNVYLTLRGFKVRAPFKSRAEVEREFGGAQFSIPAKSRRAEMAGV